MGFSWDTSALASAVTLKASHLNDGFDALQNFVNEGIGKKEIKEASTAGILPIDPYVKKGWLNSKSIYRPEFYGAPSPRMMAVSGQTHFRSVNDSWSNAACFQADVSGCDWVGVPDACTRIKLRHKASVHIMCSFYMFEFGGVTPAMSFFTGDQTRYLKGRSYEGHIAGQARLMINGGTYGPTTRRVYVSNVIPTTYFGHAIRTSEGASSEEEELAVIAQFQQNGYLIFPMIGRHQHHFTYQVDLDPGVHDIGLAFKATEQSQNLRPYVNRLSLGRNDSGYSEDDDYKTWFGVPWEERPKFYEKKNIFFSARNLVVDAYYNNNTWYEDTP